MNSAEKTNVIRISEEKRREMAKEAFWGNNEQLAGKIKLILGYEMDNKVHPANGFSLEDAVKVVQTMNSDELIDHISEPMFAIMQDDTELLSGDKTSIQMIFNNLIGRNFSGSEYENYLNWVKNQLSFSALMPERLFVTVK